MSLTPTSVPVACRKPALRANGRVAASRQPIRYREDSGWEYRCGMCGEWWPVSLEFWKPRQMGRCRSCHALADRLRKAQRYASDTLHREAMKESKRLETANRTPAEREARRAYQRSWVEKNRDKVRAYQREYKRAHPEQQRRYYQESREVILFKQRLRDRGESAA